ncbi:MAG: hypothetical protein ACLRZH_06145 [Ruthenibacterium lactatiformans]
MDDASFPAPLVGGAILCGLIGTVSSVWFFGRRVAGYRRVERIFMRSADFFTIMLSLTVPPPSASLSTVTVTFPPLGKVCQLQLCFHALYKRVSG